MNTKRIARALGWFSLALGAAELIAPRKRSGALGVRGRQGLTRTFGVREILAGAGILATGGRRAPWLWSRVAGDALDLGTLGAALKSNRKRAAVGLAIASVAAVTLLDIIAGVQLSRRGSFSRSRVMPGGRFRPHRV